MPMFAAKWQSLRKLVPFRTIWALVWPQTLMLLCTTVIGMTDVWVAGRIDSQVQAVIGMSSQIQSVFSVLAYALGAGAMAAVSQSFGAGLPLRARRYAALVLLLGVGLALLIGLLAWPFKLPLLHLLQVPPSILPLTEYFLGVILLTLPFQYLFYVGSVLFRASHNVITPLLITAVACGVNLLGDLGFGLGWFGLPAFGGKALVWVTSGVYFLASLATLVLLRSGKLLLPRLIPAWRWIKRAAPYLLQVALPAFFANLLWQSGYLTLYAVTAALPGSEIALAGMTTGMRIEAVLFMPALAFNVTASILVGNNLGAGHKQEAKRIGLATLLAGVGLMSVVAACLWPFMALMARFFSPESIPVQQQIVAYLTFNILSTPFTVGSMILNGIMTGAGATIYTLVINTSCIWLVRVPLAWYLGHQVFHDAKGVFIAMLISMAVQALVAFWVFMTRNWTRYAMRQSAAKQACNTKELAHEPTA